ncbi:MAG: hypothetical protein SPL79_11775 [Sphaerochaetaceae bacterium]|nr:hypothetical protein [Sphaerochaetaceae bacterium]
MVTGKDLLEKMDEFQEVFHKYAEARTAYNEAQKESEKAICENRYKESYQALKNIVHVIEDMRAEYDRSIGFNEAQKVSHDIVFHIQSKDEGKMNGESVVAQVTSTINMINAISPGADLLSALRIVGIASGSAIMLCDYDDRITGKPSDSSNQQLSSFKETLSVIEDISSMKGKVSSQDRFREIQTRTQFGDEQCAKVVKAYAKMVEGAGDESEPLLDLSIGDGKGNPSTSHIMKGSSTKRMADSLSRAASALTKPPEKDVFFGQMREMEDWQKDGDHNHKFRLYTEEGNNVVVNYDATREMAQAVKNRMGTDVGVKIDKKGRNKWFVDWVEE